MKNTLISFLAGLIFMAFTNVTYSNGVKNDPTTDSNNKATITGKVIDKNTGESLAGALVEIKGTDIKVYTDLEGNYSINNIAPGKYSIEIIYISYSTFKLDAFNVEAGSQEKIDIEIMPN
jgi:uncharacterized surface anchored protein